MAVKDGSVDLVVLLGYDQDIYSFNNFKPRRTNAMVRTTAPNDWLNQSHDKKTLNRYSALLSEGTKVSESQNIDLIKKLNRHVTAPEEIKDNDFIILETS